MKYVTGNFQIYLCLFNSCVIVFLFLFIHLFIYLVVVLSSGVLQKTISLKH